MKEALGVPDSISEMPRGLRAPLFQYSTYPGYGGGMSLLED